MARTDAAIAERARRQFGLITYDQLDRLGCSRARRRRLVRDGWLRPESRTVLRVGAGPFDWRTDVLAAVWSAGPGAAASHRTAARLWGFNGALSTSVDVVVPASRRVAPKGTRVWRCRELDPCDLTRIGLIPVTTRERTLIDLAVVVDHRALEGAIDGALRDHVVRRSRLIERATALRSPGRMGPEEVLQILGAGGAARAETWLERETLRLLARAGLPRPISQVVVATAERAARVDFAYYAQRLLIEVDGHRTHSTRRQRQDDAEREARLVAAGWRVIRFTYEDVVERPDYVAATIAALLSQG